MKLYQDQVKHKFRLIHMMECYRVCPIRSVLGHAISHDQIMC